MTRKGATIAVIVLRVPSLPKPARTSEAVGLSHTGHATTKPEQARNNQRGRSFIYGLHQHASLLATFVGIQILRELLDSDCRRSGDSAADDKVTFPAIITLMCNAYTVRPNVGQQELEGIISGEVRKLPSPLVRRLGRGVVVSRLVTFWSRNK